MLEEVKGTPITPETEQKFKDWFAKEWSSRRWKVALSWGVLGCSVRLLLLIALSFRLGLPRPVLAALGWAAVSPLNQANALVYGVAWAAIGYARVGWASPRRLSLGLHGRAVAAAVSFAIAVAEAASLLCSDVVGNKGVTAQGLLIWCQLFIGACEGLNMLRMREPASFSLSQLHFGDRRSVAGQIRGCRAALSAHLREWALSVAKLALPSYLVFGWWVSRGWVSGPTRGLFGTLWDAVDVGLWATLAAVLLAALLLRDLSALIFQALLTQPLSLDVASKRTGAFEESAKPPLSVAIQMKDCVPLYYLGFLELCRVSTSSDAAARRPVFAVSRPGGHPWDWLTLERSLGATLDAATAELGDAALRLGAEWDARAPDDAAEPTAERERLLQPTHVRRRPALRSQNRTAQMNGDLAHKKMPGAGGWAKGVLASWRGESAVSDVWVVGRAAEALGSLGVASRSEDEFGVVQEQLPAIFARLILLQSAADRYSRLRGIAAKSDPLWAAELSGLRQTISTTLLRLHATFEDNIRHINLEDGHRSLLDHFIGKEQMTK